MNNQALFPKVCHDPCERHPLEHWGCVAGAQVARLTRTLRLGALHLLCFGPESCLAQLQTLLRS